MTLGYYEYYSSLRWKLNQAAVSDESWIQEAPRLSEVLKPNLSDSVK